MKYLSLAMLNKECAVSSPLLRTIFAKYPSSLVISVSESFIVRSLNGWSYSMPCPLFITRILSESIIVANLCAIIRTVQWSKFYLSFCYIKLSVSKSILAVASSNTMILFFYNIALAKQSNYFYPVEKILLLSFISVYILSFNELMWSSRWTSSKA